MQAAIVAVVLLLIGTVGAWAAEGVPTDNPVAGYYDGPDGYPAWTDSIDWGNVINMKAYANGKNDFEKFENARDELAAKGGGVLYYPAGLYDFKDAPADGPKGRGLMLKTGVVIRGEAPAGRPNAAKDGKLTLATKFVFAFQKKAGGDGDKKWSGEVPRDWNLVGLCPETGKGVKDVNNVGICWVHIEGAVVYFGADFAWGPTWREGKSWRSRSAKGAWGDRRPDGTHPYDPYMAGGQVDSNGARYPDGTPVDDYQGMPPSAEGKTVVSAGKGRLVFGCVLEDSCLLNDFDNQGRKEAPEGFGATGFHMARYTARIAAYGSRVLVANNYLPMSKKRCFAFEQKTIQGIAGRGNDMRFGPTRTSTVLFDYSKVIGIDVNKDLLGSVQADLLKTLRGGFFEQGAVVRDNWVYNHGHKGFVLSADYGVFRDNHNERDLLESGRDPYGIGGWKLTIDGFIESAGGGCGAVSDNYSRAFDVGGRNLWIDGNWFNNLGSHPGNDGEGILCQLHAGTHVYSWAITHNTHERGTGHTSYMGAWNAEMLGCLIAWNKTPGWVGVAMPYKAADLAFVGSRAASVNSQKTPGAIIAPPAGQPAPPTNVKAEVYEGDAVRITWSDASDNEIGFRVDRSLDGGKTWAKIAYRPPHVEGSDKNPQEWIDFMCPSGKPAVYRVVAIGVEDGDIGASAATPAVKLGAGPTK